MRRIHAMNPKQFSTIKTPLLLSCIALATTSFGRVEWDATSMKIDGERKFLISGEFHYFRVPKEAWRTRLRQLKAVGGTCVATYIPWIVHEPEEGRIVFGDRPERDLDAFLKVVEEEHLLAMVRPGPYQYSELVYSGLPRWLVEGHPEIAMKQPDGVHFRPGTVDYNHPYFLKKTRDYFKAVAEVLRPHMAANGGCIALVQLDNELTGIHTWYGYPRTVEYFERCADYLVTLRDYLAEFGIGGPYCHNAGGAMMAAYYTPCVRKLGTTDFLMGYDHYYNLGNSFSGYNPTVEYYYSALFACDMMRTYGYPPIGLEIQAGTIGDFPPILKEDLLACHMSNLAAGLKGINYYVFTGGPNVFDTGCTVDVYDYSAPIAADGTPRPTYQSLKAFGDFVAAHPELLEASPRLASVRLGFEWMHYSGCAKFDENFLRAGVLNALMRTALPPEFFPLDGAIDTSKPMILAGVESMSAEAQRKVAEFVKAGGGLLVTPDFPRTDNDGKPCTLLADAVGAPAATAVPPETRAEPVNQIGGQRIYELTPKLRFDTLPPDAQRTLLSEDGTRTYGCTWRHGKGKVAQLAATWSTKFFNQADMLAGLLTDLGAKPIVTSSNRNVFTAAYRLKSGALGVFALNLQASPQSTTVTDASSASHHFDLHAMEVGYAELTH